jgi:hypothetical protein
LNISPIASEADPLQVNVRVEAVRTRLPKTGEEDARTAAAADVVADDLGLRAVANDQVPAAGVLQGLGRRGPGLLVVHLAVDDGGVALLGISLHVLPDVQHGSARRVHHRAAAGLQIEQQAHGDAKRRENHHVPGPEGRDGLAGIRENADAERTQAVVDLRVVDDLARQVDLAARKAAPCLVGVVDGAVDAIAEAEFAREVDDEPRELVAEPGGLDGRDQVAPIVGRQLGCDLVAEVQALAEDERGGRHAFTVTRGSR